MPLKILSATGGGGGAPSGPAGGDLGGTYPNPQIAASVALTGTPTAPTQTTGDNTTAIATDAFVQTAAGLLIPKSLVTAKGDLVSASGSGTPVRMPVGSDGAPLIADSTQTPGLRYGAPSLPALWPFGTFVNGVAQQNNTSRELKLYVTSRLQPTVGNPTAEADFYIGSTSSNVALIGWSISNYTAGAANDESTLVEFVVPPFWWVLFLWTAAGMAHLAYRYNT